MAETPKETLKRTERISKVAKDSLLIAQQKEASLSREKETLKEMVRLGEKLTATQQKQYNAMVKAEKKQKAKQKAKESEEKTAVRLAKLDKNHTKNLTKVAQLNRKNQGFSKNMFGLTTRRNNLAQDNLEILKKQNAAGAIAPDLADDLTQATLEIASGQQDVLGLKDQEAELSNKLIGLDAEADAATITRIKDTIALNQAEQGRLEVNESINDTLKGGDSLIGGMGGQIKSFMMNPLTAVLAILVAFEAETAAIGDEFGAIGVTEFGDDLRGASNEFRKMGLEGKDALTSARQLSTEFGIGFENAIDLADTVGDVAKSTGLAVSESAKLIGMFTELGGLTESQSEELAKSTESLAHANGVAPNTVLKDIADSSEVFAKFSGVGAKGLARAAVQARKLGIELKDSAGAMEGMLDFSSSLNAEIEASVLLGRNLNLQKARELSLAGDIEGFQAEILKQVGSQAEFDKMNVVQKEALAKATGFGVEQLQKMVSKEKEVAKLSEQIKPIDELVPAATIGAVAELMNTLKGLGMSIANSVGPAISGFASILSGLLSGLSEIYLLTPLLIALMGAFTINTISSTAATMAQAAATIGLISAKKVETAVEATSQATKKKGILLSLRSAGTSIIEAVSKFFLGASKMSASTFGFGALIGTAMAAAAIGMMMGSYMSAKSAGDLNSPAKGTTQISTKEGGLFNMSKNDDILAGPGLAGAMGGGGSVTNVDTSGIERGTQQTVAAVDKLAEKFESAFGVGGSAAKQIGNKVATGFENIRNS